MSDRRAARPEVSGTCLQPLFSQLIAVAETTPGGLSVAHQRVPAATLFLTIAGSCSFTVDGLRGRHVPGSLVLIRSGAALQEVTPPDTSWQARYLWLIGPFAEAVSAELARLGTPVLAHATPASRWRTLAASAIDEVFEGRPAWSWRFLQHLSQLMGSMLTGPHPTEAPGSVEQQLLALIEEDPDRPWTMDEIARELGVSVSTLSHQTAKRLGEAPSAVLRRRRIERARFLLNQGLTVAAVAEQMGFSSPFALSRAYARVTGVPPSVHRPATGGLRRPRRAAD